MLYDCIDVLAFLEESEIKHGEINPHLLFLHYFDREYRVKICERLYGSSNNMINNFHSINQGNPIYLNPTDFQNIFKGKKEQEENFFKADVFALGLCFLEVCLLENI